MRSTSGRTPARHAPTERPAPRRQCRATTTGAPAEGTRLDRLRHEEIAGRAAVATGCAAPLQPDPRPVAHTGRDADLVLPRPAFHAGAMAVRARFVDDNPRSVACRARRRER